MGLRERFARAGRGKEEIIAERLCEQFADLQMTPLAEMPMRERVNVCGEIRRMTVKPRGGIPAVEVEISDGTEHITLIFSGRNYIPGIGHNRGLVVCGVAHKEGSRRVMLNPMYRLLPKPGH